MLLLYLLNWLNVIVDGNDEVLVVFVQNIIVLCIIALFTFMYVVGYFFTIIIIRKYKIEEKYPKLIVFIRYYEKVNIGFIIFETFLCLFCLVSLI